MKGDRANKQKAEEYEEGFYRIQRCFSGKWTVVDGCIGIDQVFDTLHDARQWCIEHPADPEFEGKYA